MSVRDFLAISRSVWGVSVAAVLAGPLGVWAGRLDPPAPPGLAVVIAIPFCVVLLLLCLLWAPRVPAIARKWLATALLVAGIFILAGYVGSYFDSVVHQTKETPEGLQLLRVVTGSELRKGVEAMGRSKRDLLIDYEFDETQIWTEASLRATQTRLHVLFTVAFALLTGGIGILGAQDAMK